MVDAATASPPSKNLPVGSGAIKVVASYSDSEHRKLKIEPLLRNSFQSNHKTEPICESYLRKQEIYNTHCCCNCVDESVGSSVQRNVPSEQLSVFNKDSESTEDLYSGISLQNIEVDNNVTNRLPYLNVITIESNNYNRNSNLNDIISEGIFDTTGESAESTPVIGQERLL